MQDKKAVNKGWDFIYKDIRYQIKGTRPSGKRGSKVTKVPKAKHYDLWDVLIWVNYDKEYTIKEAWKWDVKHYKETFEFQKRISPDDMSKGENICG